MTQTHHVLVAEDNPAMRGVIRFALEKAGLEVTIAKCGQEAWDLLSELDVDLILTDFHMPGMTGGQLCERVRQDARLERIPVILLTAKGFELDTTHYMDELAVSAIIPKPFSPRELTRTVKNCLAVKAAGS